ncbi:hypothetical protein ACFSCW_16625 [Sphingomonas tabacisoli]|uniref:Uncharacterized protein n=1 Tax=Sphingomonas tabacisoli TaxID=2249466 RepID=A0ABW4I862_9SPHN
MASNAVTTTTRAYRPEDDHWASFAPPGAPKPGFRHDGWTPFRQQVFLRSIAEGKTVELACAGVGLSVQSAYAFRNRASGAAFALGWAAAKLLARERIADTLLTRALEGQIETVTRSDGLTVDRLKYDNRTALGLLARLDRQAESNSAAAQAARLVAQEFEAYTEALVRDDSPARAGLFLGTRAVTEAEAELAPVIALARADRFARAGASLTQEVDVTDLDLTQRAGWTADQWQRAEAAGLLAVSPLPLAGGAGGGPVEEEDADEDSFSPTQFPQLRYRDEGLPPVWEDETYGPVTDFPPPDDYAGKQVGEWGEQDYMRTLTTAEEAAFLARPPEPEDEHTTAARAIDARERDLFFGFVKEEGAREEPSLRRPGLEPGSRLLGDVEEEAGCRVGPGMTIMADLSNSAPPAPAPQPAAP